MNSLFLALALLGAPPQAVTTDSLLVIDASTATAGRYIFVVDISDGVPTIRQIKTVVSINVGTSPAPVPPAPTPTPQPPGPPSTFDGEVERWLGLVADAEKPKTAAGLSRAASGLSDLIDDKTITTADSARKSWTILTAGYLATVQKFTAWSPFIEKLDDYLKGKALADISAALKATAAILKEVE